MAPQAWSLLRSLGRWSTGSIHKFAEELGVDANDLLVSVRELQARGLLVAFPMKDDTPFENAMLEISQEGLDFIEAHSGQITEG